MDIREAIAALHEFHENDTLFAERIAGHFRPESRVVALKLSDYEAERPVSEVAAARAPGTDYLLEVHIAREVIEGWRFNHGGAAPTLEEAVECVIYYAENDAYPEQFFGDRARQ